MSLEKTVKEKLAAKYDPELEKKLRTWYVAATQHSPSNFRITGF
jgi:hypothetical protein